MIRDPKMVFGKYPNGRLKLIPPFLDINLYNPFGDIYKSRVYCYPEALRPGVFKSSAYQRDLMGSGVSQRAQLRCKQFPDETGKTLINIIFYLFRKQDWVILYPLLILPFNKRIQPTHSVMVLLNATKCFFYGTNLITFLLAHTQKSQVDNGFHHSFTNPFFVRPTPFIIFVLLNC